jgi:hypothetical protein
MNKIDIMGASEFEKKLLEDKKRLVLNVVEDLVRKRNLPKPYVNFDGCEGEDEDSLAHYHSEGNIICISERQLHKLDFESLKDVITHEVTHIIVQDHSPNFYNENATSSIAHWEPPGGTIVVGNSENKSKRKNNPIKIDKTRCNYHLCRKNRKLEQCKFCENYYCSEHVQPAPPIIGFPLDRLVCGKPVSYWRNLKEAHPCFPYVEYSERKEEKRKEEEYKNFDMFLRRKHPYIFVMDKPETQKENKPTIKTINLDTIVNKYTQEYFVWRVFNPHFNDIMIDSADSEQDYIAEELINLRNDLLRREFKNNKKIKESILKIREFIIDKKQKRLYDAFKSFCSNVHKDYNIEILPIEEQLTPEQDIEEPQQEPPKRVEEDKPTKKIKIDRKDIILILITLTILVVLIFSFINFMPQNNNLHTNISSVSKIDINKTYINKTITKKIEENISFNSFLNNKQEYNNKIVSLKGFLRHKLVNISGKDISLWVYFIVDDYDNEIILTKINTQQERLFVLKGTTKEIYNVTGTFVASEPIIEIINISLSKREIWIIKETIVEQIQ